MTRSLTSSQRRAYQADPQELNRLGIPKWPQKLARMPNSVFLCFSLYLQPCCVLHGFYIYPQFV